MSYRVLMRESIAAAFLLFAHLIGSNSSRQTETGRAGEMRISPPQSAQPATCPVKRGAHQHLLSQKVSSIPQEYPDTVTFDLRQTKATQRTQRKVRRFLKQAEAKEKEIRRKLFLLPTAIPPAKTPEASGRLTVTSMSCRETAVPRTHNQICGMTHNVSTAE